MGEDKNVKLIGKGVGGKEKGQRGKAKGKRREKREAHLLVSCCTLVEIWLLLMLLYSFRPMEKYELQTNSVK